MMESSIKVVTMNPAKVNYLVGEFNKIERKNK